MEGQIMGIPRGKEGLKSQNFKSKEWGLTGISRGVGDLSQNTLLGRDMDISITIYFW